MTLFRIPLGVLIATTALFIASVSHATVTCTINGSAKLEPQDSYYCDPDILGASACTGWREVDIDEKTMPMEYMAIGVYTTSDTKLGSTTTDGNGNWSLTFQLGGSQCQGQIVNIRQYFARAHEADVGSPTPRWRFWIVDIDFSGQVPDPGNNLHVKDENKTLSGPTTTHTRQWSRTETSTTGRLANVYFTVNSMMKEITQWSTNLEQSFTFGPLSGPLLRIGFDYGYNEAATTLGPYDMLVGRNAYGYGAVIRHELGHVTHAHIHHRERDGDCQSYAFDFQACDDGCTPGDANCRCNTRSCEYGATAMSEALSSFFATRSIMGSGTNTKVWNCSCWDGPLDRDNNGINNWDICSEHAALASDPDSDNDFYYTCTTGDLTPTFWHLGDSVSASVASCVHLRWDGGCDCPDSGWCNTSYKLSTGWRNTAQVTRFLWDMFDATTDNGQDDTNLSIQQLVSYMEGMPCSGNLGGQDGSCEEQAPPPGGSCNPATDGATTPNGTGTRDAYNPRDFGDLLPGDQSSERTINCVAAPD